MTIRLGSGLVVDDQMDLSRGAYNDFIASDALRRGGSITRIVNAYHQKDTQSGVGERPARKITGQ